MWKTRGCTRCGGDMYKTRTDEGDVLCCLQCGQERPFGPARPTMSIEEIRAILMDDSEPDQAA